MSKRTNGIKLKNPENAWKACYAKSQDIICIEVVKILDL